MPTGGKCDGASEQVANPLTRKLRRRQRAGAVLRERLHAPAVHPLPAMKQRSRASPANEAPERENSLSQEGEG
jgi:hypothetical protein